MPQVANPGSQDSEDDQFPVLFKDGRLKVYKNPSGEIFVEDVRTGALLRIGTDGRGLMLTAFGHKIQPEVVGGSIGYSVRIPHSQRGI
jgi:hypothetical protein